MTDNAENYSTEAEKKAYYDGWREGTEDFYELEQVRKIACALIVQRDIPEQRTASSIAALAWTIWNALKAGQEKRK